MKQVICILYWLVCLPGCLCAQTLDPAFHVPEIYGEASVTDVVQMPSGQFVVAGTFSRANGQPVAKLARFSATGALDQTFQANLNGAALQITQLYPMANGQLLVQGSYQLGAVQRQYVFRLNADGTLDPTFTLTFSGTYPYPKVIQTIVQPDGRVLVLGFLTGNGSNADLIRLLPNGSPDPSFQTSLEIISQTGTAMLLQPDGKVLIGNTLRKMNGASKWWFGRLNSDGTTDTTFQPGVVPGTSYLVTGTNTMVLEASGSLLVGGYSGNQVAGRTQAVFRLLSSGALDPNFTLDPSLAGRNCLQLAVQPSGAIVALFDSYVTTNSQYQPLPFSSQLVRLLPNGTLDATFQPGSGADAALGLLRSLPTGNLLTCGSMRNFAGQRRTLALLQPNGGLDASFAPLLQVPGSVKKMVRQADGKLLLAGNFDSIDGHLTDQVARLLPTGAPDLTFSWRQPASATWLTTALAVQADGRVLLAGSTYWSNMFTATSATYQQQLTRLTVSGAPDASFVPALTLGATSGYGVQLLAEQPDGNLLVGGSFVDAAGKPNLTRLTPTGSVEPTFMPAAAHPAVSAGLLQANGALVCIIRSSTGQTLERLLANGQPDPIFSYAPVSATYSAVEQVIADPTTGGYLTGGVLNATQVIGRITATGSEVPGFTTPFRPIPAGFTPATYSGVNALVLQPDGRLLVGGYMQQNSVFNAPTTLLARLTSTSQLDASFSTTLLPQVTGATRAGNTVEALVLQPDGAILVGGYFLTAAGQPATGLVRLLAPGTLATQSTHSTDRDVQVWPVPAHDELHLSLAATAQPQRVSLLNTLGQVVRTQAVAQPELVLPTAGLTRGVYVLRIECATAVVTRSIVLE